MGVRLITLVRRLRREVPAGDSDADLLVRFARNGDASAFELLVWRHGAMVLSACRRILAHAEDAEDAFQAVFLVLARKAGGIGRGTALPAWLHRVAVRVATRLARSRKPVVPIESQPVAEPVPDPAVTAETLRALDEEIDRLPERCRRAVVLCYLEGLTAAEAAQRLGCPTGTIESRLAAARKRLHARLARRGFALPVGVLVALGSVALAPEAVANVARVSLLFARGEVSALGGESVRLAKGVLAMWRTRVWAAVTTAVALAAMTATANFAWTDEPVAPVPPVAISPPQPQTDPLREIVEAVTKAESQPAQPKASDPLTPEHWSGKPVWVASTVARLYDVSPDGKWFLYADGRKFGVFDRTTGKMVWQIDNGTIHSAAFSPNGRTVVAGEWQNGLNLYDAATGKSLHSFVPPGQERIWQARFVADGTVLYSSYDSFGSSKPPWRKTYTVVYWDPISRKEVRSFHGTIEYNGHVWLWHRGEGFFLEKLHAPDGNASDSQNVCYIDPATGKATKPFNLEPNDTIFDLSPDGKDVLVRTVGKDPRVLETATGKKTLTLTGHKCVVTGGAFSSDGKLIATVSGTKLSNYDRARLYEQHTGPAEVIVWEAKTGKQISRTEFPIKELDFAQVRFSPDSKFLIALSRDGKDGKERKLVALGLMPFAETGGVELNFPADEELKPKPPAPPAAAPVVSDALDKLVDELAKSNKSAADKVDALFLATLGRFATAQEQKWVKTTIGDKPTADMLRLLLAEIVKSPEFRAHSETLQKRVPAKPKDSNPLLDNPIENPFDWPKKPVFPGTNPGGRLPGTPEYPFGAPSKPAPQGSPYGGISRDDYIELLRELGVRVPGDNPPLWNGMQLPVLPESGKPTPKKP